MEGDGAVVVEGGMAFTGVKSFRSRRARLNASTASVPLVWLRTSPRSHQPRAVLISLLS